MPVIQMNSSFPSSSVRALPAEDVYVLGESLTSEDDGEAVPGPDLLLSPRLAVVISSSEVGLIPG